MALGGLDVTVTNNDVNPQALANPLAAILVQSNCLTVCNTVRSDVRGNTVPAPFRRHRSADHLH